MSQAYDNASEATSGSDSRWVSWSQQLIWVSLSFLIIVFSWSVYQKYRQLSRLNAVRCDQPIFDFQKAFPGDTIDHTFHVINTSGQPLTIDKVMTSCGCTTIQKGLEGKTVAVGEAFDVTGKLSVSNSEYGEVARSIIVSFKGEEKRQIILKFKGNVADRWKLSADHVVFENATNNQSESREVIFTLDPSASPVQAPKILIPVKCPLKADVTPMTSADSRTFRCKISTIPPIKGGRQEFTLMTFTDDGSRGSQPIKVVITSKN